VTKHGKPARLMQFYGVDIARMVRTKACWAKAVSLSKVMELAQRRFDRANTARRRYRTSDSEETLVTNFSQAS
jgi:hypothetical protein